MQSANDFQINGEWQKFFVMNGLRIATKAYKLHRYILYKVENSEKGNNYFYEHATVSIEFLDFQFFANWCQNQIGYNKIDEFGRIWCIDKDILSKGNLVYGPEFCCFIPNTLNSLILKRVNKGSKLPPGVNYNNSGNFRVTCVDSTGVQRSLGAYKTPEIAFAVYKSAKEKAIKERALQYQKEIDVRVFNSLINWVIEYNDY